MARADKAQTKMDKARKSRALDKAQIHAKSRISIKNLNGKTRKAG